VEVHLEDLAPEQRGLIAARSRAQLHDHALLVERVLGEQQALDLVVELLQAAAERGDLGRSLSAQIGVVDEIAGVVRLRLQARSLAVEVDDLLQFRVALRRLPVALRVRQQLRVGQTALQGVELLAKVLKLLSHYLRLYCRMALLPGSRSDSGSGQSQVAGARQFRRDER